MTLHHGLFVSGASAGVTSPKDARLALGAMLSGAGVLSGGAVSGNSAGPNMEYDLAAGQFITARGTASVDGLYLFVNDGTITVDSGAPAPASGSRWDLIWVRHQNAYGSDGFGDANSDPVIGVTVGTSGSTPTKPYASVPAGALVLAESSVGTSIANASLAVITQVVSAATLAGVQGKYIDYVPRLTDASNGTVIASTVGYARYAIFGKTVDCKGSVTANAAVTAGHGIACDLPLTGRERELVCGTAGVFLGTPATQTGLAIMNGDLARFSPMSSYGAGLVDIASGQVLRWRIRYELP